MYCALITGYANVASDAIALGNLSNTSDSQPKVKSGFGSVRLPRGQLRIKRALPHYV